MATILFSNKGLFSFLLKDFSEEEIKFDTISKSLGRYSREKSSAQESWARSLLEENKIDMIENSYNC